VTTHGDAVGSSASAATSAPILPDHDVGAARPDTAKAGPSSNTSDRTGKDVPQKPEVPRSAASAEPADGGTDAPLPADKETASADDQPPAEDKPEAKDQKPAGDEPPAEDEPVAAAEPDAGDSDTAILEPAPPAEAPPAVGALAEALSTLRAAIGGAAYPLVMPSADEARRVGAALVSQLDDYLLPRLARLDAPLLVVVGGSTGAGKSTLVNSLVRAPVSAAGVLRPTTRSPVLVSNPADLPWFRKGELLPGLVRTTESSTDPRTLRLVAAPALGPGLAFLDAPDIDSVVDQNRQLAAQLLAAADLWLFVTTAARYADAVPWELLTTARLRGTVIALVLDRVPSGAAGEISAHLGEMLATHKMSAAPVFVLPETTLDGQGLLPEDVVRPLHDWFAQLAADANARAAVVRQSTGWPTRRTSKRRPRPRSRNGSSRRIGTRGARSSKGCRTAACCAARCWPAGRSSSAPASCCARWSPRSGRFGTGWSRR
jgi:hypothetical protein